MHMSCSWKEQGMCICYKTEYFYNFFIEFYYRCTCLVLGKNKVGASVIKQNIFINFFIEFYYRCTCLVLGKNKVCASVIKQNIFIEFVPPFSRIVVLFQLVYR